DRRARSAVARPRRFLRHAAGGHADLPVDRSRSRSRAARHGAAGGCAVVRGVGAGRRRNRQAACELAGTGEVDRGRVRHRDHEDTKARSSTKKSLRGSGHGGTGAMRVIAGSLKGRRLKAPTWVGLRPTSDKLRETLFNILAPRIEGARVLDGYAGTGAIGIEALS